MYLPSDVDALVFTILMVQNLPLVVMQPVALPIFDERNWQNHA